MEVVNVKVAYIRKPKDGTPAYHDLRQWMSDPNNVYIGRKGIVFVVNDDGSKMRWPPRDSIWANPYKLKDCKDGQQCLQLYREYIINKIKSGLITPADIEFLRGKRLGCWCKLPDKEVPCHGDIIMDILHH